MRVFSYLLLFMVILSSCSRTIDSREDLKVFIAKNRSDFVKTRRFKSFEVTSKFLPEEILLRELSDTLSNGMTFNFEIKSPHKDFLKRICSSYDEYRQYKWYLTNEASNFIYLEQGGKVIKPDIALFEEQYELSKGCEYNVVFDKTEIDPNQPVTFVYNDEIFGMGKLKFQYDTPRITNLPINIENYYNSL